MLVKGFYVGRIARKYSGGMLGDPLCHLHSSHGFSKYSYQERTTFLSVPLAMYKGNRAHEENSK